VRLVRAIQKCAGVIAFPVGLAGFCVQWLMFNEHPTAAAAKIFIPFLGEHGVYVSRGYGIAWYIFNGAFVICLCFLLPTMRKDKRI
jgi:hypothetical protein